MSVRTIYKEMLKRNRKARINRVTGNNYDIIVYDDERCEGYTVWLSPEKPPDVFQVWDFQNVYDCGPNPYTELMKEKKP